MLTGTLSLANITSSLRNKTEGQSQTQNETSARCLGYNAITILSTLTGYTLSQTRSILQQQLHNFGVSVICSRFERGVATWYPDVHVRSVFEQ
jgi:hypothetical protein